MFSWIGLVQIVIIAIILWFFYKAFIKNTSSEKLVHGLFGLGILWIISFVMTWAGLNLLGTFLHWTALFLSVGLVVIFQPELRKFLALMGNVKLLGGLFSSVISGKKTGRNSPTKSVDEIFSAVEYMSAKHTGALIVFQNKYDNTAIEKVGTKIDAIITKELLLTIFFDKTPLHDGAVIIDESRISSAGAILPLSKNELNWNYGTRHRAALGLTEISKSIVLVVSEETGTISIAENGAFKKYEDMKKLRSRLEKIMK